MSTDYVFRGDKGNYREDDEVYPFNNYAWSKLGGECAVRQYDKALIVRATFGQKPFPFEKAFIDQWTSKLDVRSLARAIKHLISSDITGIIHVGAKRRSVADYARSISPEKKIQEASSSYSGGNYPRDTSLDCGKFDKMFNYFRND